MSKAILQAVSLTRSAPANGRLLLDAVDLELTPGECVAIVGPSGSGKTVLLRALAWLDPLDAGEVLFNGRSPREIGVPSFRRRVMYLHQTPWLPEGSVEAALRQPLALAGYAADRNTYEGCLERVAQWLDALGRRETFMQQATRDLSGGERQIVALLRAMQLSPEVLLLDEPMAALDARAQRDGEHLIVKWLNDAPSRAIVLVTHDEPQARRMADRVLHMAAGRLKAP